MSSKNSSWRTKQPLEMMMIIIVLVQLIGNTIAYETYYMDHQVTEKQARNAIREAYNRTQKDGVPNWCGECTEDINNYCLSQNLIQDHCCCDQAHGTENIPWMPHSCYMGEEQCKPVAASCIDYMHRRQCCCDKLLVEFLHHEYSTATIGTRPYWLGVILPIVMLTVHKAYN